MAELRDIKTDEYTLKSGHLNVTGGHKVYYEQWGNPKAKTPILFFHGGPGSNYKPSHKNHFDPHLNQVIFFDQRGIGNSLPYGKIINNSTDDVIDDAKKIVDFLNFKKVHVFGGSWGAALALLFSIKKQPRVVSTIVNGVFTASKSESDYLTKGRAKYFYPEAWEKLIKNVPADNVDSPYSYNANILLNSNKNPEVIKAAKALQEFDIPVLNFDWQDKPEYLGEKGNDDEYDVVPYRILAHYLINDYFMPDDYIIENAATIKSPLYIVQGRYDMACRPIIAYKIHKKVKNSKLFMTLGSHSTSDPENRTALKILINTVLV